MTDPSPQNTGNSGNNVPATGVGAKDIGKILLVIVAVVVPLGLRVISAQRKFERANPGQAERDRMEQERQARAIEEMRGQIERGEAGEATQRLFGVPPDKIKKQQPRKPRPMPEADAESIEGDAAIGREASPDDPTPAPGEARTAPDDPTPAPE